jgi:uncharacterized RDD family membrane protein YckC
MNTRLDAEREGGLQGHYAGIVTRITAFLIDIVVSAALYLLLLVLIRLGVEFVSNHTITWGDHQVVTIVGFAVWEILYFALPWSASGKSLGMAIVGIRVVRTDGSPVGFGRAVVRIVTLPLSIVFALIGVLMILVQPEHRAVHDLIAGTVVVYSWDARAAQLHFMASQQNR